MNNEEKVELVLNEYKKGNIIYLDITGAKKVKLEHFVKQPLDGILYDLNRLEEVIITNLDKDEKWVNDFALVKLLRHYHDENERLKNGR